MTGTYYTLTGTYVHGDGSARVGRVKFEPSTSVVGDPEIILPSPLSVDLDSSGSFTVDLAATDDATWSPEGWVWQVTESMDGGRAAWAFELTADSDIADLSAAAIPPDYTVYVSIGDELTASLTSGAATVGYVPTADGAGAIAWAAQSGEGGGAGLSDADPADLGTTAPGTGLSSSRDDHVHGIPTASDVGASATGHGHTLSDVSDAGGAAALNVGTTTGTVAAGDDSRITGAVQKATYDAHTLLAATTDNTPAAVTVAEQTLVGRITGGNIAALTKTQGKALLDVDDLEGGSAAVNTVAATGATETLPATYAAHKLTMDQNCTLTFPTPSQAGHSFTLLLSGAFTPTWPASVDWNGGSAPTYATPSLFVFTTLDTGTTWLGAMIGSGFA